MIKTKKKLAFLLIVTVVLTSVFSGRQIRNAKAAAISKDLLITVYDEKKNDNKAVYKYSELIKEREITAVADAEYDVKWPKSKTTVKYYTKDKTTGKYGTVDTMPEPSATPTQNKVVDIDGNNDEGCYYSTVAYLIAYQKSNEKNATCILYNNWKLTSEYNSEDSNYHYRLKKLEPGIKYTISVIEMKLKQIKDRNTNEILWKETVVVDLDSVSNSSPDPTSSPEPTATPKPTFKSYELVKSWDFNAKSSTKTLKWKKNSNAVGYAVYNDDTEEIVYTTYKNTKVSYKLKKLKKGKRYRYSVHAMLP